MGKRIFFRNKFLRKKNQFSLLFFFSKKNKLLHLFPKTGSKSNIDLKVRTCNFTGFRFTDAEHIGDIIFGGCRSFSFVIYRSCWWFFFNLIDYGYWFFICSIGDVFFLFFYLKISKTDELCKTTLFNLNLLWNIYPNDIGIVHNSE